MHFLNAKAECAETKIESIPSADEDDEPACSLVGQKLKTSEIHFILNELNLHSNLNFKYSQVCFNHQFCLVDMSLLSNNRSW